MNTSKLMTAVATLATALGLAGNAVGEPPAVGRNAQFAFTVPIFDSVSPFSGDAICSDEDEDGHCDGGIAFITKSGFWGVRIEGVDLNGVGPLTVCLIDTGVNFGAVPLAEGLEPVGPKNVIAAGGDVFTDNGGWPDLFFPGFAVLSGNWPGECGNDENPDVVVEFVGGIRLD